MKAYREFSSEFALVAKMRQQNIVGVAYGLNGLFSGSNGHSMNIDRIIELVLLDVDHCAGGWKEECSA